MKRGDIVATSTLHPLIGLIIDGNERDTSRDRMVLVIWSHAGTGRLYSVPAQILEVISEAR